MGIRGMFSHPSNLSSTLDHISAWFIEIISQIKELSLPFLAALQERLLPLILASESVWGDPIYIVAAVVILAVVVIYIASHFFGVVNQVILYLFQNIEAAMKTLFRWFVAPLTWLFNKLSNLKNTREKTPFWQRFNFIQVTRTIKAIRYITTTKDWRYDMPWFLLIGENNSGKKALVAAATKDRRTRILPKESNLKEPGSGWHFFKHAVVIVSGKSDVIYGDSYVKDTEADNAPTGDLVDAQHVGIKDSSSSKLTQQLGFTKQKYFERFNHLIQLLHWYRPERPIDGIILTVSAKSLLNVGDPASMQVLGENLFKQLWQSQKQTGFVLPVYLVVTQCDHIKGFDAFWQAQPSRRYDEIIGWSNPYRIDCAFSKDWLKEAFTQVVSNLESAKLQLAASGKEIDDIDKLMLFKHYFSKIQAPLAEVLNRTFSRSSFQEAMPLRGIYFTGQVDNQVSFVNDFFRKKVFAEKHLAYPIEKKFFSTQKTLKRFQISSILSAIFLSFLLIIDAIRFSGFVQRSNDILPKLVKEYHDCTEQGVNTMHLLKALTNLNNRPVLLSMPVSWSNLFEKRHQEQVADKVIKNVLFENLSCGLERKAKSLSLELEKGQYNNYRDQLHRISSFSDLIVNYQVNQHRFTDLTSTGIAKDDVKSKLAELLGYLYEIPVDESIDLGASLLVGSIQKANVKESKDGQEAKGVIKPSIDHDAVLEHLANDTKAMHDLMLDYTNKLPLGKIIAISDDLTKTAKIENLKGSKLLIHINQLQSWLKQTNKDWLTVTSNNSPCGRVYELLLNVEEKLAASKYNEAKLKDIVNEFSPVNCDDVIRDELAKIQIEPFGSMFVYDKDKNLVVSDVLQRLSRQIVALESLNFVRSNYPPIINSEQNVVKWLQVPLTELLNVLISYQEFVSNQEGENKPFFANNLFTRLQQVSERLISISQVRASDEKFVSYLGQSESVASEAELEKSVNSFITVSGSLLQLKRMLLQLGDKSNAISLQNNIDSFVLQQLAVLENLMEEERLYQSVLSPKWKDNRDYRRILFDLTNDSQIKNHLKKELRRLDYIAFSYAEPLIQFLQNSASANINDDIAQRWFHTINELGRAQRNVADNKVIMLDNFISNTLVGLNNTNCYEYTGIDESSDGVSWLTKRQQDLSEQVTKHCQQSGQAHIIKRYLAIQSRFNQELAGHFPFAKLSKAGKRDISPRKLQRFFEFYRQESASLLKDMKSFERQNAKNISPSWIDFISQMDQVSEFFQRHWDNKSQQWNIPLNVTFSALPELSKGSNQIIKWTLSADDKQIVFPNGETVMSWTIGQQLQLNLKWASGSAFSPQKSYQFDDQNLHIDSNKKVASFTTRGGWGLFEWLAAYSANERLGLQVNQQNKSLLSFDVPVGLKVPDSEKSPTHQGSNKDHSSVSRANLLIWNEFINTKGDVQRMALPGVLPQIAPGEGSSNDD